MHGPALYFKQRIYAYAVLTGLAALRWPPHPQFQQLLLAYSAAPQQVVLCIVMPGLQLTTATHILHPSIHLTCLNQCVGQDGMTSPAN